MSKKQALIVEDTAANRMFFERLLMQAGFEVVGVETGQAALEQADANFSDIVRVFTTEEICMENTLTETKVK